MFQLNQQVKWVDIEFLNFDEVQLDVWQHKRGLSDDGQSPFACFCEEVSHHVEKEDHWEGHDENLLVDQAEGKLHPNAPILTLKTELGSVPRSPDFHNFFKTGQEKNFFCTAKIHGFEDWLTGGEGNTAHCGI